MGRILRWGLLQLCQSLVNGFYLHSLLTVAAGDHRNFHSEVEHSNLQPDSFRFDRHCLRFDKHATIVQQVFVQ